MRIYTVPRIDKITCEGTILSISFRHNAPDMIQPGKPVSKGVVTLDLIGDMEEPDLEFISLVTRVVSSITPLVSLDSVGSPFINDHHMTGAVLASVMDHLCDFIGGISGSEDSEMLSGVLSSLLSIEMEVQ